MSVFTRAAQKATGLLTRTSPRQPLRECHLTDTWRLSTTWLGNVRGGENVCWKEATAHAKGRQARVLGPREGPGEQEGEQQESKAAAGPGRALQGPWESGIFILEAIGEPFTEGLSKSLS